MMYDALDGRHSIDAIDDVILLLYDAIDDVILIWWP